MDVAIALIVGIVTLVAAVTRKRKRGGRSIPKASPETVAAARQIAATGARGRGGKATSQRPARPAAPAASAAIPADSRGTIARNAARAEAALSEADFTVAPFDAPVFDAGPTPARKRPGALAQFRTSRGLLGAIVASEVLAPPAAFGPRSVADRDD